MNLYNTNDIVNDNQKMYDAFNTFIFSNDRNVFNKLYSKFEFYERTKHLAGDIVECGVFKGSGLSSWLKILQLKEPNTLKKVIGFDIFDPSFIDDISDKIDQSTMKQVFDRDKGLTKNDVSFEGVKTKLVDAGFPLDKFELIKGDVKETTKTYIEERPGARISLLYLDMDLYEPTMNALKNLLPIVVKGGIIIFDEYGYHKWSESAAADVICEQLGTKLYRTEMKAPSAYIIKE